MRRSATLGMLLMIPALLLLAVTPGCGKKDQPPVSKKTDNKNSEPETKKSETPAGSKKPLEAKLDGIIKGQVTYDGDPPTADPIKAIQDHKDKDQCLKGMDFEKSSQDWIVNKTNKGVANVVLWLTPPAGTFFNLRPEDKKRTDEVKLDQPHCAFIPHVVALFPVYFDGSKRVPTGQKFVVLNDAEVPHNTKIRGDAFANPQKSQTIPPHGKAPFDVNYQSKPLEIGCDFHPWMNALAFTFDNPYHAVTDLDGNFKIDNVPTGVDLTVVAWHQFKPNFEKKTIKFKTGNNTLDLKVKK